MRTEGGCGNWERLGYRLEAGRHRKRLTWPAQQSMGNKLVYIVITFSYHVFSHTPSFFRLDRLDCASTLGWLRILAKLGLNLRLCRLRDALALPVTPREAGQFITQDSECPGMEDGLMPVAPTADLYQRIGSARHCTEAELYVPLSPFLSVPGSFPRMRAVRKRISVVAGSMPPSFMSLAVRPGKEEGDILRDLPRNRPRLQPRG